MRVRRIELESPLPCCVCGWPSPRAEEIVGVVIPWCDFDYWTYIVRRAPKVTPLPRAGRGA